MRTRLLELQMASDRLENQPGKILIVDDNHENLEMLQALLATIGHSARIAASGQEALEAAGQERPDLVLLDINMPDMDGYEVCRRMKENPQLRAVPVIFISGRADTEDKTLAFAAGGVDYLTKPYVPEELESRLTTHLKLRRAQQALEEYTNNLEDLVVRRTQELAEAHRRLQVLDSTKREFLDVIAHELRTPATGVLGIGELAIRGLLDPDERRELAELFDRASLRLLQTINSALLLAELQTPDASLTSETLDLKNLCLSAVEGSQVLATEGGHTIRLPQKDVLYRVVGNPHLSEQCLTTLLNVAFKMAAPGTPVALDCREEKEFILVLLRCEGRTFPEATLASLLEAFSYQRISSYVEELGLTIPLAAQIAALFGGKVEIHNAQAPEGIEIELSLKRAET
jgi:two-component system, sensor histidine kinase and response regulator